MKLRPEWGGPLLTAGAVAVIDLVFRTTQAVPDPGAVLSLAVVYSAFSGGGRGGSFSAAIACLYVIYFFSTPGEIFHYHAENLRRVILWLAVMPALVVTATVMKRRTDHALDAVLRRERDHSASLATSLAERTRAETALRALFERNLAGIFRSRRDGRILECNGALVHLLGFASRDEVLARNATEFYADPADRERLLKLLQPGVVVSNHELPWRRADGLPIWVLINVREVVEGPATYLEGIVLDITDRKRAEARARAEGS